ncbi:Eco57I restriction-modification methylase domain-containing protein [Helicobacter sp. 13S00477-4]|uniref:type IIG restriction enzyme/methyltransferase n=1 Tax=Helicobacter sp. 13S00477-4 TaxID=1905759 RepID=UPI000BA65AA7|nr:Eco57I restriction-modification methylase domain-containing protein [Helicobacter sp. 13S00477-4]PAF52238.1 hypothetical protein BKH44_03815 [Helicobacter sp. 13S00477-4]
MRYTQIPLKDFLKNLSIPYPNEENITSLKKQLSLLKQTNKSESEEHQKNNINIFLKNTFGYIINTKEKIDAAIFEDNEVRVIIEAKSFNNKAQFPTSSKTLESKAFYESILYYLRESITNKNNHIKHIILCNLESFYIVDALEYHKYFEKDKAIHKLFNDTQNKHGNDTSTKRFYDELEAYLRDNLEVEIFYAHFSLREKLDEENLALIYQILSPTFLLKQRVSFEANLLNQNFYNELLYILGLEEKQEERKIIITPSEVKNTLLDSIVQNLGFNRYEDFEDIFSLLTTWNNRILFLRLLESMLLSFNHIQKPFLDIESIPDFDSLNALFFEVLAKKEDGRTDVPAPLTSIPYLNSSLFEKTDLESDEQNIGKNNKQIKFLRSKPLTLYKNSILKKNTTHQKDSLELLEYLFAFLNAYDFTTTSKDIQSHTKINLDKLINSSVLGLVFEKLNGYKEGSFYTPSFITNYMCKTSIEEIILNKFNTKKNWQCKNITDLHNKIEDIKEANEIFNTIKICDPAVGSGHFLVSALNQLIFFKYQLGILCDETYRKLKDIQLEIHNDEIIIIDSNNEIFNYSLPAHMNVESHKIQKSLFHTKKELIENCLFGVDINPNSCEITKLRLWIELLKYTYYKDIDKKTLQTLPNIDINIKEGNSLVSFFPIDSKLKVGLKKSFSNNLSQSIKDYKTQVSSYKEALSNKKQILTKIQNIKTMFLNYLIEEHPKTANLKKNLSKFIFEYGDACFDFKEAFGMEMIKIFRENNFKFTPTLTDAEPKTIDKKAKKILEELKNDFEFLESTKTSKSFEWRFEFPEILDNQGDFIGFDLVIGNPPYIRQENIKELKPYLQKNFEIYTATADIFTYFFEQGYKILSNKGLLSFITSNKWVRTGYGKGLRNFILEKTKLQSYVDFNGIKVFDSASVDTSIISFSKQVAKNVDFNYISIKEKPIIAQDIEEFSKTTLNTSALSAESFNFSDPLTLGIKQKIESIGTPLKDWDIKIYRGILTGYNEAFIIDTDKRDEILSLCDDSKLSNLPFIDVDGEYILYEESGETNKDNIIYLNERQRTEQIIKPILRGRDIKRYSYEWAGKWVIGTHNGYKKGLIKIPAIDIDDYPTIKIHLNQFDEQITKRTDKGNTPYNLRNCAYWEDFNKRKIIYPNMAKEFVAFLDKEGFMTNDKSFIITESSIDNKDRLPYLTAILNCKTNFWYFKQIGVTLGASGYEMRKIFVERLPIPKHKDKKIIKEIESLATSILESKTKQKDTSTQEIQLDNLIYKLYNLTDKEIDLIESEFASTERERERERERESRNN